MFTVIGCIVQEHDLGLAAMALAVCVLAALISVKLLARAAESLTWFRPAWIAAATGTFSCGVWTMHCIGMLVVVPGLRSGFTPGLCALTVVVVGVPLQIAFSQWVDRPRSWQAAVICGLAIDASISGMHCVGMRALQLPLLSHLDPLLFATLVGAGAVLATTAMRRLTRTRTLRAALLLSLAIAPLHLMTMRAVAAGVVVLDHSGRINDTSMTIDRSSLAMLTGGGCLLIMVVALTAFWLDRFIRTRVADQAHRFRALADATFEGLIVERAGLIIDINRAMCRLMGVEADKLIGRAVASVLNGQAELRPASFERPLEYELLLPDGGIRPVEVLWRSGPDPHGHVLAVRDLSREKAAQLQIHRMTHFDQLTGVANRQMLEKKLQQALAPLEWAPVGIALLCIDLDRFTAINDALGVGIGDQVLIQAARRLQGLVHNSDLVARIGSDEFAVIQSLAGQPADAAMLAEQIVTELGLPFEIDGHNIMIGASVGAALYPADGMTTLDLMSKAMLALDRAKREGRSTWRYCEPGMDSRLRDRRMLERDLRVALSKGQLYVVYQPFYDAMTLRVAGYEALVRWNHPVRGIVSPADFIPIAEESGLIVAIGQFVLQTACTEAAGWSRRLGIAVNLSPAQLAQEQVVATVDAVLQDTGLDPSRLELEITEGMLVDNTNQAVKTLLELKDLGVTLAMDDFGTGYSSLSYLRKFPFDKLKIDRSFIRDLDDTAEGLSIVAAIIAMSRSLRLEVTAEGVETPRQLALLQAERCAYIQGFLLGRPLLAEQIDCHGFIAALPATDFATVGGAAPVGAVAALTQLTG